MPARLDTPAARVCVVVALAFAFAAPAYPRDGSRTSVASAAPAHVRWLMQKMTPISAEIDGVVIAANTDAGVLSAIDVFTGTVLWKRDMPQASCTCRASVRALPGGLVLVPDGEGVIAVELLTGESKWQHSNVAYVEVSGDAVALEVKGSGDLIVVDALTGAERWRRECACSLIGVTEHRFITDGSKPGAHAAHPIDGSAPTLLASREGDARPSWMGNVGFASGFLWDWDTLGARLTDGTAWTPADSIKSLLDHPRIRAIDERLIIESNRGIAEVDAVQNVIRWAAPLDLASDNSGWDSDSDYAGRNRGFTLRGADLYAVVQPSGGKARELVHLETQHGAIVERLQLPSFDGIVADVHVASGVALIVTQPGQWFAVDCAKCTGANERVRESPKAKRTTFPAVTYRSPRLGEKDVAVERVAYAVLEEPPDLKDIDVNDVAIEPAATASVKLIGDRTIEIRGTWAYGVSYKILARGRLTRGGSFDEALAAFAIGQAPASAAKTSGLAVRHCKAAVLDEKVKAQLGISPDQWCGAIPLRFAPSPEGIQDRALALVWTHPSEPPATYQEAERACAARGHGWRLPTVLEALSLLTPASGNELFVPAAFREPHPDARADEPEWAAHRRLESSNFYRYWVRWFRPPDDGAVEGVLNVGVGTIEPVPTAYEPFSPPTFRYFCVRGV